MKKMVTGKGKGHRDNDSAGIELQEETRRMGEGSQSGHS